MTRKPSSGILTIVLAALCTIFFPACGKKSSTPDIPCELVAEEFMQFVRDHQECSMDDICTIVLTAGSCNCVPYLGTLSCYSIRKDAEQQAREYINRFYSEECSQQERPRICDAYAECEAVCISGKCSSRTTYFCGPDGGIKDGG